uniref:Uncharacterized protein n=1 Tax=Tetradesmus obliquus TaxID=3088 RepID=A0A383W8W7_TETOB|eukprot:jgi/Sobl393_1/4899/SZX73861.1
MSASVLSRKSVKEQIESKGKALSWVRKRVEKLQEENERLAYQHQLVSELCKVFDWFRHMQLHALQPDPELMVTDDASEQLTPGSMQQQFTDILQTEAEVQLLQQLSSLSVSQQSSSNCSASLATAADNSSQASSNRACPASSCQLVAPPGDAMWLVKQAFQQPWPHDCPSADTVTVPALVQHFRATVHALSLQLVQLDACTDAAQQAESLRKVQTVLLPHLRIIVELCSSSRGRHLLGIVYLGSSFLNLTRSASHG